jgi:tetratricopeptide (TPR) repeat protein
MFRWLILLVIGSVFFFTPYSRGLFFDSDLYAIEALLTGALSVWIFFTFSKNTKIKISSIQLLSFLIPIYFIVLFIVAESPKGNLDNVLRWMAYCSFFTLLLWIREDIKIKKLLPYVFHITGITIALFSLFGYWGWINYRDIVLLERLTGPFQYANTFAAITGAFLLFSLSLLTYSSKNRYHIIVFSAPLVVYGVNFFATSSRGALLVLPIAWLVVFVIMKFKAQVMSFAYTLEVLLFSVLASVLMNHTAENYLKCLIIIFLSCLLITVNIMFAKYLDKMVGFLESRAFIQKYSCFLLPSILIILTILLGMDLVFHGVVYSILPEAYQNRIESFNIQEFSIAGRLQIFFDTFRISYQSLLMGYGGEGWKVIYANEQSKPYYSNEIHSGYLEMLISGGIIGIVLLVGLLAFFMYKIIRRYRKEQAVDIENTVIIAAAASLSMLLLHSIIDFNFSYGYVWLLIFWLIAIALPENKVIMAVTNRKKTLVLVGKSFLTILVMVSCIISIRIYSADNAVERAQSNGVPTLEEGQRLLTDIVAKDPLNVDRRINLVELELQMLKNSNNQELKANIIKQLAKIEQLEPNNERIMAAIASFYAQLSDSVQAIEYMEKAIIKGKYNINNYTAAINYKAQLAALSLSEGNSVKAKEYASSAVEDYKAYLNWFNIYNGGYIPDQREIRISMSTHLNAAKAYLMNNEPEQAIEVLLPYNPSIEAGIYNREQHQLLTDSFDFMTLSDLLTVYKDYTILISVRGEAVSALNENHFTLFEKLNSNIKGLQAGEAYAAVFSGGTVISEKLGAGKPVHIDNVSVPVINQIFGSKPISIYSSGLNSGNYSSIMVDNVQYSTNEPGMNIVVLNKEFKPVIRVNFDTRVSDIRVFTK